MSTYTDNPRDWKEHHPDGDFINWHKCPWCENKYIGFSAFECPLCAYETDKLNRSTDDDQS